MNATTLAEMVRDERTTGLRRLAETYRKSGNDEFLAIVQGELVRRAGGTVYARNAGGTDYDLHTGDGHPCGIIRRDHENGEWVWVTRHGHGTADTVAACERAAAASMVG